MGHAGLRYPKIERRHMHSAANHSAASEAHRLPARGPVRDHNSRETDCPKGSVRELLVHDTIDHLRGGSHSPPDAFNEIIGYFIRLKIERSNLRALFEQFVPSLCLHTVHSRPPAKLSLKHTVECQGECFYGFVDCIVIDLSSAAVRKLLKGFRLPNGKDVMHRQLVKCCYDHTLIEAISVRLKNARQLVG